MQASKVNRQRIIRKTFQEINEINARAKSCSVKNQQWYLWPAAARAKWPVSTRLKFQSLEPLKELGEISSLKISR